MFHLDYIDKIDDILIYKNKIYLSKDNKITSKYIEEKLSELEYDFKSSIIDSKTENSKIPSIEKVFYTMIFNLKRIPTVEELLDTYIHSNFVENKDYTYSEKDYSIKFPNRYSYIGLKNRVYNDYLLLIKYYHLYLIFSESEEFDKIVYSLKNEIYKGLILNLTHKNNSYKLVVKYDNTISLYIKNYNTNEYINLKTFDVNNKLEYKVNNFKLFNKEMINMIKIIIESETIQ